MEPKTERPNDHALYEALRKRTSRVAYAMRSEDELTSQVMNALPKQQHKTIFRRVAAIFITFIMVSGLVLAMWTILHTKQQQITSNRIVASSVEEADSIVLFDHTRLDSILSVISTHYGYPVTYAGTVLKHLRLHTRWNRRQPLNHFILQFNELDDIQLILRNDSLIVSFAEPNPKP